MSQLLANERAIISTRQHWSMVVPGLVAVAIALIAVIVVLHIVPASIAGHSPSTIVNGLRWVIVVVAVIAALIRYLQWRASVYLLTDRRIVVTHGIVSKVTESITLDRIQDVIIRQSIAARMLGAGTVDIESAGRDGIEVLHRIAHPQAFYNALMEAMEAHRTGAGGGGVAAAPAAPATNGTP